MGMAATQKRHRGIQKTPGKLQRMQSQISDLAKTQEDLEDTRIHEFAIGSGKVLRHRKQMRKNLRKLKKAHRHAYHTGQQMPTLRDMNKPIKQKKKKAKKRKASKLRTLSPSKTGDNEQLEDEEIISDEETGSADDLMKQNADDLKIIRQLEKKMKMTRRKSLPKSFHDEGLDYLLDTIGSYEHGGSGSGTLLSTLDDEQDLEEFSRSTDTTMPVSTNNGAEGGDDDTDEEDGDNDDDMSYDFTDISEDGDDVSNYTIESSSTGNAPITKSILKKNKTVIDHKEENSFSKSVSFMSHLPDAASQTDGDSTSTQSGESGQTKRLIADVSEPEKFKEDIYGRLRDASGNVVQSQSYVPPAKRMMLDEPVDEKAAQKLNLLSKQLRGFINRTSESNMRSISSSVESLYRQYSRADVNNTLTQHILDACILATITPERLAIELVMLVAILHSNVGTEVGAYFLQTLIRRFNALYELSHQEEKHMENCLLLLAHLLNFQVIHCCLIFDIIKILNDSFREKDIELILLLVKSCGFTLRKDDPQALREMISSIQKNAQEADMSKFGDKSRVRYMLDILLAIKNNNMRKIPNYDTSHINHLQKTLHVYVQGSKGEGQLRIHYKDLLNAETHGRWWIVGSAWSRASDETGKLTNDLEVPEGSLTNEMLLLAGKQRMNTENRKKIFCLIMSADDYIDAYEQLLHLNLQHKQERDIIYVAVDCCLHEKPYNQYYSYLIQKFCDYERRFQMTVQFHVWDKLKILAEMPQTNRTNLAQLVSQLISMKAVSLSLLKVVEFGTLTKEMAEFLRSCLSHLLKNPPSMIRSIFARVITEPKLRRLCDGLKLYMQHFMVNSKDSHAFIDSINLACDMLSSGYNKLQL